MRITIIALLLSITCLGSTTSCLVYFKEDPSNIFELIGKIEDKDNDFLIIKGEVREQSRIKGLNKFKVKKDSCLTLNQRNAYKKKVENAKKSEIKLSPKDKGIVDTYINLIGGRAEEK